MLKRIQRLLIANRGEIAIRVMRPATELGVRTIGIYSQEERFSLHRTRADEACLVGAPMPEKWSRSRSRPGRA